MSKDKAISLASEVAAYLKDQHGATRVLLFGSTISGTFLPQHSDIDLYVEGLPYDREFEITGETLCKFPAMHLDLMPAGHAPDYLRKEIEATGVVL